MQLGDRRLPSNVFEQHTLHKGPSLIETVTRSGPISVTSLPFLNSCLLRLVFESETAYDPVLPPTPSAILGRLLHNAISEEKTGRPGAIKGVIRKILDREILIDSRASESGEVALRDAVGVSYLLRRMPRDNRDREIIPPNVEQRERIGEPPLKRSVERTLTSTTLELRGRLDLLEVRGDWARVTDYKTGSIWKDTGEPKEEYLLQLVAYGLLVQDNGLASNIELRLIGADGEWSNRLDATAIHPVIRGLKHLKTQIQIGHVVRSDDIAQVGSACQYCDYRPSCPSYAAQAPSLWDTNEEVGYRLPNDTWGRIEGLETAPDGFRVYLADASDRYVCVFGVPKRFVKNSLPGDNIAFFSLKALTHENPPRNFRLASDRSHNSAHAALVILDWPPASP